MHLVQRRRVGRGGVPVTASVTVEAHRLDPQRHGRTVTVHGRTGRLLAISTQGGATDASKPTLVRLTVQWVPGQRGETVEVDPDETIEVGP